MKKIIIFLSLLVISFYLLFRRHLDNSDAQVIPATVEQHNKTQKRDDPNYNQINKDDLKNKVEISEAAIFQNFEIPLNSAEKSGVLTDSAGPNLLTYAIEDGLAVVHGDLIVGEIPRDEILKSLSGSVKEPTLKTWPTSEIPIYIQPNFKNPARIDEALAYFAGTNIHFIPYTDQQDAIVFETSQGACKSYLGYVGGTQPIFLSEQCSAQAIAHEIMHALGFLHEQNRSDRDDYIDIIWSNIDSRSSVNFEKFSNSMMKVSGLTKFDFESIMIYPQTMFSSNGQITMKSKIDGFTVSPRQGLSSKDKERINKIY